MCPKNPTNNNNSNNTGFSCELAGVPCWVPAAGSITERFQGETRGPCFWTLESLARGCPEVWARQACLAQPSLTQLGKVSRMG